MSKRYRIKQMVRPYAYEVGEIVDYRDPALDCYYLVLVDKPEGGVDAWYADVYRINELKPIYRVRVKEEAIMPGVRMRMYGIRSVI